MWPFSPALGPLSHHPCFNARGLGILGLAPGRPSPQPPLVPTPPPGPLPAHSSPPASAFARPHGCRVHSHSTSPSTRILPPLIGHHPSPSHPWPMREQQPQISLSEGGPSGPPCRRSEEVQCYTCFKGFTALGLRRHAPTCRRRCLADAVARSTRHGVPLAQTPAAPPSTTCLLHLH